MSNHSYPSFKDSGLPWLGRVPAHWCIKPLWAVASCNDEVLPETTAGDLSISYIEISDVEAGRGITSSEELLFASAPSRARRIVKHGDVIVSTVRTYLRAIGRVLPEHSNCIVSTGFAVLRPATVHEGYLSYLLTTEFMIAEIISRSTGVSYPALNASELMKLKFALPHVAEQQTIAIFLDRETAKIDALVAEQQHLLLLLAEERLARVTHLVTKGLNPDVRRKPSGVPWLGDLPDHWTVSPLMRLTDPKRPIMYGIVLPGPDVGEGVPILKGGNVRPSRLRLQFLARTTPELEAPYARARLRGGDLVYSIRGSIGDCEIVPPELEGANITQDVARVAPLANVSAEWLRYALLAKPIQEELACGSLGAAVRGINIFDLKRVRIPTPPRSEQHAIAARLGSALQSIEALHIEAMRAIFLLRERRAGLISAAVTGKMDVRGLVPAAEPAREAA